MHSHITDELPSKHPLANEQVYCKSCGELVHAANNECMQTWVETGDGSFCVTCFADTPDIAVLSLRYGINE